MRVGLIGFCAFLTCLQTTVASAAVITFETVATSGCQVQDGGTVDGFTLGSIADAFAGGSGGFNNSAACALVVPTANSGVQYMVNYNALMGDFTRDLGTFDLLSLYAHADIRDGAATVRFQGLDGVGGNVLYSMDVLVAASWQQILFPNWNNVRTFTWNPLAPNSTNIAIDDVEYNVAAVPEPTTLLLLGSGLGLAVRRRRLNRRP